MKIAFTGHRPNKLYGYDKNEEGNQKILEIMGKKIEQYIIDNNGEVEFTSGMALGTDIWLADIVVKLRRKYPKVKLHCALPIENHSKMWNKKDKAIHSKMLDKADSYEIVSEGDYTSKCMLVRDAYMVERADMLLAVFDGSKSGTGHTIDLAVSKGKKVAILCPKTFENSFK